MSKKRALSVIVVLLLVVILLVFYSYQKRNSVPWSVKELNGKKQSIDKNGYHIELSGYLYDDYAKVGFCLFRVPCSTTEDGRNSMAGFGQNDRFELYHVPSVASDSKTIKVRDELEIYYRFLADTDNNDDMIYLYDGESGKIHDISSEKSSSGKFELKNNVKSRRYKMDEYRDLYLSSVCVGIVNDTGGVAVMPGNLQLCYKDGKSAMLITDSEVNSEYISLKENNEKHSFERCVFRDIIDVDEIEYVVINGERY